MKRNKITIVLLSLLASLCLIASACASEQESSSEAKVELKDWVAQSEISVDLGANCSVNAGTVYDTENNSYREAATVKTTAGEAVIVVAGEFIAEDLGGYVITYSVKITDSDTRTRTVTVKVADNGKPIISIANANTGYVGKKYTLPAVKVNDMSGETITPVLKLFLLGENDAETEVELTDNAFVPATRGNYVLKVEATDGSGNKGTNEAKFSVRNAIKDGAIEDFNDPMSVASSTNFVNGKCTKEPEYFETFQGRTGVVSNNTGSQDYPNVMYQFPMTAEQLAATGFDRLYIMVYIDQDKEDGYTLYQRNISYGTVPAKTWTKIVLTADMIAGGSSNSWYMDAGVAQAGETPMQTFCRVMTQPGGFNLFWGYLGTDTDVYIDEITYSCAAEVTSNLEEEYMLGSEIDLAFTAEGLEDYSFNYTVTDPTGVAVEVANNAFTVLKTGTYTVVGDLVHATEYGKLTVTINVDSLYTIHIPAYTETVNVGDEVTLPTAVVKDKQEAEVSGASFSISVTFYGEPVELVDGKLVPEEGGNYVVTYTATLDKGSISDSITIAVEFADRAAPLANEVENFNDSRSLANVIVGSGSDPADKTWLYSYEGEKGVVRVDFQKNAWPWFSFIPRQQMTAYAYYDYLVVRVFVVDSANALMYMKLGNDDTTTSFPVDGQSDIVKGAWKDYIFPIAPFLQWYGQTLEETPSFSKARIWSQSAGGEGTIYIADISVWNKVDYEMNVTGKQVIGNEVTVSVSNAQSLEFAMKVTAPSGKEVTLTDGKFTPDEVGTYKVNLSCDVEGYYGTEVKEFVIIPAIEAQVTAMEDVVPGTDVTVPQAKLMNTTENKEITEGVTAEVKVIYYGTEVEVENGVFNATTAGKYEITYALTYNEVKYETRTTLNVPRNEAAANEIESFDCAGCQENITMKSSTSKEYIAELCPDGGTHGSLEFTIDQSSENWPILYCAARRPLADYAAYNNIKMTFYITSAKADAKVEMYFFVGNKIKAIVAVNTWVTVDLDMDLFRMYGYDTLTTTDKGWFWFTNVGGTTVQKIAFYDIKATAEAELSGTQFGIYNSQEAVNGLGTEGTSVITYVSAEKIASSNKLLPDAPDGYDSYASIFNSTAAQWFNVKAKPQCSYNTFLASDNLVLRMYLKTDASVTSVPMYYFNRKFADVTTNTWTSVKMPLAMYRYTSHSSKNFENPKELYLALLSGNEKLFMLVNQSAYTVYLAGIELETLPKMVENDNFTLMDTDHITVNDGTVTAETFDERQCIKIVSSSTWCNIFVTPTKNFSELSSYSKVVVTLYIEGSVDVPFYAQYNATGSSNIFEPFGTYATGRWVTIEIPVETMFKIYYNITVNKEAMMIDQGKAFSAIYIASIICE